MPAPKTSSTRGAPRDGYYAVGGFGDATAPSNLAAGILAEAVALADGAGLLSNAMETLPVLIEYRIYSLLHVLVEDEVCGLLHLCGGDDQGARFRF